MAVATATLFAAASLGVGVVSTLGQASAQKKSAANQRAAAEEQKRSAEIAAVRNARSEFNRRRITAGMVTNSSATSGTMLSSGYEGGISSLSTQLGQNMGTTSQQLASSTIVGNYSIASGTAQAQAAQWGAIGGLSNTIFADAGGMKTIFGMPQVNPGQVVTG